MASPSPPVLPVSTPQTTPATINATPSVPQPPIATPAFRAFFNHITESVRQGLSQRRPWAELVDRSAFSKPESFSDAVLRVRKNFTYFKVNYLSSVVLIVAVSLLTHPISLILLLALLSSWLFLYLFRPSGQPLVLFGRTFSDRETLGMLIISTIVVLFLTSVGSVLISAFLVGFALICAHGSFRVPEDLFMDEQEQATTGFLSFLSNAATKVATSSAPAVPGRV